jgi:hypothetical protein
VRHYIYLKNNNIILQFDESIDNMGDVSAEQEQFEDAAESLKLDLSDDKVLP